MDEIKQLGYVGVGASDMAAWESFAGDVLGMQAAPRSSEVSDAPLHLRMDDYQRRITVHPGGSDDLEYLGLEVAGEAQLEIVRKRLENAGFTTEWGSDKEAADRFVTGLLKVADPDGVAIEIYYGHLLCPEEPFHSPRPISGFVAGDLGLGHAVLCVADMKSSVAFYRDVLGFRISDLITFEPAPGFEVTITFFHCNPRHHTLALLQAPLPQRLNHIMVELQSLDDVGATYELCRDREVPIGMHLGRHTNDHMLSFYMASPSGFQIEYGWGGQLIDDATWRVQTHGATSIWGHRQGGSS